MTNMLTRQWPLAAVVLSLVLAAGGSAAAEKIRVVATIPDLADITRQIGKERVAVESLTLGVRDIHAVQVKPSMVTRLNRADAVVLMGLSLEHAFLPALLDVAANPQISRGGIGHIDTSAGVSVLGPPKTLSRRGGDVHPTGNPHYNLDPVMGKLIAHNIAEGLSRVRAEHRPFFMKNLEAYVAELDRRIPEWQRAARGLKGVRYVSYHDDMAYFAKRYGMRLFGTLESAPGIGPTPAHIVQLVERMKAARVPLVVYGTYPDRVPRRVARETGAALVQVPLYVGGRPGVDSHIKLIDYLVTRLSEAAGR